jgi:fructose-bisphosphate aldolase, class I
VIDIGAGIPSYACIHANAHALARYAALCQEAQIVPIVEPEVLMDGDHDIDRCYEVTEFVLKETFPAALLSEGRARRHGAQAEHGDRRQEEREEAGVEEVAEKTVKLLKACVPARCRASPSSPAASPTRRRPPISTP